MKKTVTYLFLIILPVFLFVIFYYIKYSSGEYFLYSDPAYVYLFNSLNLAQIFGYGVGHIDHPGTTVQIIGAVVIKLFYFLDGLYPNLISDVIFRTEFYLLRINFVLVLLISAALFLLGFKVFQKTNNLFTAIFFQLTPLISATLYFNISNVSPEPMLIFTSLVFITLLFCYINLKDYSSKSDLKYLIGFGIICGFGLATKISFFPVLIIPVIMFRRISYKIFFLFFSVLTFFIIISMVINFEQIGQFSGWIQNIIMHSDLYGQGSDKIVNAGSFLKNIKSIFKNEIVFSVTYVLAFTCIALKLIPPFKEKIKLDKYFHLLTAVFLTMNLQLIIVAKHFNFRYMIPALMLSVLGLFSVYFVAKDLIEKYLPNRKMIYLSAVLLIFFSFQIRSFILVTEDLIYKQNEAHKISYSFDGELMYPVVIGTNKSSWKVSALYHGIKYSGSQRDNYYNASQNIISNRFCYNIWFNDFEITDSNYIKDQLSINNKFIFLCREKSELESFIAKIKKLMEIESVEYKNLESTGRGETVYEITLNQKK